MKKNIDGSQSKVMKATAQAPANIAFVKYWGKADDALTLPRNSSISMNLDSLHTTTTVEFDAALTEDEITLGFFGEPDTVVSGSKRDRVSKVLDQVRARAKSSLRARVLSRNNFPAEAGIASSASAFAALTTAAISAFGLQLSETELSIQTRLAGSGSAARSIPDGFVVWEKGHDSASSFAHSIAGHTHWALYDIVLVVATGSKAVSSLEGHHLAATSPFYEARLRELPDRLHKIETAIRNHDLQSLGEESEKDMISFHTTAMTSQPPIFYWNGASVDVMAEIRALRGQGIPAYYTLDAGPNVHVLCEGENVAKVQTYFEKHPLVKHVFVAKAGPGVRLISEHLF